MSKINLPEQFKNRMKEYLGVSYEAFIASYETSEVKGLRMSRGRAFCHGECPSAMRSVSLDSTGDTDASGALESRVLYTLGAGDGFNVNWQKVPWFDNGYYLNLDVFNEIKPGKHPLHEAGAYYIQEPSAMAPVTYLDIKPGERVLDLCASPGGKSTQIAALMQGEGILIANEIMPDRAKILSENIERMGVKNALVISEDPRNISDRFYGFFDKILVDAPCSGEGMFRRSETAINEWSPENVSNCAKRQEWILDEAAKMLREGGTLCYSTCTFSKEENELQIVNFLSRHEEFSLGEMTQFDGMSKGFTVGEYESVGVRIFPHEANGEGHYLCKLVKSSKMSELRSGSYVENDEEAFRLSGDKASGELEHGAIGHDARVIKAMPLGGFEPELSKKDAADLKEMYKFFEETFSETSDFLEYIKERKITRFKDQIYLLPKECPKLNGLKVLRPGLHLGTILKNRFEPGHALAKCLESFDVKRACVLPPDSDEAKKYIAGETFSFDGDLPGWYVIFAGMYPLGWGKLTNSIMKNHYPKGLRKRL